eukprot:296986-Hanusia_phi.AAC.3
MVQDIVRHAKGSDEDDRCNIADDAGVVVTVRIITGVVDGFVVLLHDVDQSTLDLLAEQAHLVALLHDEGVDFADVTHAELLPLLGSILVFAVEHVLAGLGVVDLHGEIAVIPLFGVNSDEVAQLGGRVHELLGSVVLGHNQALHEAGVLQSDRGHAGGLLGSEMRRQREAAAPAEARAVAGAREISLTPRGAGEGDLGYRDRGGDLGGGGVSLHAGLYEGHDQHKADNDRTGPLELDGVRNSG